MLININNLFHCPIIDYMKTSTRVNFSFLFFVACIPILASVFVTFDEFHDGWILSTIQQTRLSIDTGGNYPSNQYGSFWAIFGAVISKPFPSDLKNFMMVGFCPLFNKLDFQSTLVAIIPAINMEVFGQYLAP